MNTDDVLLRWVQLRLRTQRREIRVPADLVAGATPLGLKRVQILGHLCGVKVIVERPAEPPQDSGAAP